MRATSSRPPAALLAITATIAALAAWPAVAAAAPTVSVGAMPAAASGTISLSATTSWDAKQVKWYIDGAEVGWDGAAAWTVSWNSKSVADGTHTIFAKAADAYGAWGTSAFVSFTVKNAVALVPPTGVQVTAPDSGATVQGTFALGATASDPSGIREMKWFVDGTEVGWDGSSPWQATWNSANVANGTHSIFARALTGAGVWIQSSSLTFGVQNAVAVAPPSKWNLLVSEDFDGTTLDTTKWSVYGPNWSGHAGNGLRDGRAVSVGNGMLTITAQMLDGVLVSSGVKSRIDRRYGRYEFRVRTDADPSAATSGCVLTWPQSENWPIDGENNIYETTTASRYPFSSFIHYSSLNKQYWFHHYADGTQWHTMAMEWEPDAIRIYRNGALVWTVTDAYAIPDVAHHVVMQLDAVKPWMSGAVRLQVDYMRIYERVT